MKSWSNLYEKITSFENLYLAAKKARQGKRYKPNTARFDLHLEKNLLELQKSLRERTWQPGSYSTFEIYEPKRRLISAAPYADRVVHHALCNIIEPLFDRTFIYDSYANRKGKGTHRALDRLTAFSRRNRFSLKGDLRKYFPSIDHEILCGKMARKIRDKDAFWLIEAIVASSNPQEPSCEYFPGDDLFAPFERRKGLPIGNLTSQFFANVYLNDFDHFMKEEMGCRHYIRYVDDFVVLADDKDWLKQVLCLAEKYLEDLRLHLHPHKCQVFPVSQGIDFLGFRVFKDHRLLRRANAVRFQRRLRRLVADYRNGCLPLDAVDRSIQSWIAHAAHANTYGLRRRLLSACVFQRESVRNA